MKKNIVQFVILILLSVFSIVSFAQDNRTLDTKVADILAQMPAKNQDLYNQVMAELVSLGPDGFMKIAGSLTPPGIGDDSAVRFALNGVSRYASQFGKEKERLFVEENLLKALEKQADTEVKTFLMNQLNLVAGTKTFDALSNYLTDEQFVEPATQTILSASCPNSASYFMAALPEAGEHGKITLIRALGELKCTNAVSQITPFVHSDGNNLKKSALAALAKIGAPESYKTLLKAASDVDFEYEATNASESFLEYANRLGEQNEIELMKKACAVVFKTCKTPALLHNYSKALTIYSTYLGYEATPFLLDAVDNSDKAFRNSVLNLAEKNGGIADTRKWIDKANDSNVEIKSEIISMLGRRGCDFATSFVTDNLNSTSEEIRKEAITALAKLQGNKAAKTLIEHLAKGKDIETTKITLLQLLDKKHLAPLAKELNNTSGETKAAVIELIASKSGTNYFSEVVKITTAANEVEKMAAFAALKKVSGEENIDELVDLLLKLENENEISEIQHALVAAASGVEVERQKNGIILSNLFRIEDSKKKARIIEILPEIGGQVALETVINSFKTPIGPLQKSALEALTNWKAYSAAQPLFEIYTKTQGENRSKAFSGFIRLVQSANIPDDQKLLQYRKIMPFISATEEKNTVLSAIGQLKAFLALVFLEPYLDENELAETASRSVMRIALPNADGENGFSGKIVKRILGKALKTLTGADSEYEKINIKKYLDEMPDDVGFISMFNGKNLDGWQGMIAGGNPLKIAALSEKEREKAQEEANKKMRENWGVEDGTIVFSGHGANLVSEKIYKDFELIVDWLISKEGDSGIYLRGTPQVQIWDTSRVEVGAQVGSGGLYNNNKNNVRNPLKVADNPVNEWNTFRITMIGEHVTVYLNGELVVDNVKMDNYWDRNIPIFETGTIELQAHGNRLKFRDIYVREINTQEIGLSQEEIDEGFVSLFNGKNLDGWQGNKTDYYAKNGELVVNPKMGGHGNLFTEKEYRDFIFRFEFQLTPGANNGLGIRAPLEGDAAYVGMELQILDNTAAIYANLEDYQYHGSVYGVIPAKRGFLNPVGDWNLQEVIVKGSEIKITLNGQVILNGDIKEASKNGTLDGKKHPGLERESGYIGFLGHGSELKFKNIRIKDLYQK